VIDLLLRVVRSSIHYFVCFICLSIFSCIVSSSVHGIPLTPHSEHLGLIEPQIPLGRDDVATSFMHPAPIPNDSEFGCREDDLVADPLSDEVMGLWYAVWSSLPRERPLMRLYSYLNPFQRRVVYSLLTLAGATLRTATDASSASCSRRCRRTSSARTSSTRSTCPRCARATSCPECRCRRSRAVSRRSGGRSWRCRSCVLALSFAACDMC
jgi:hypothetical protein